MQRSSELRRQRTGTAGDPDVGAPEAALAHQGRDDVTGRVVDRYGEPEPDPGYRRIDPDQAGLTVGERTAGVPRVQRSIGLDHVLDDARGRGRTGRQRPAERRDDACRDRAREPVGIADRHHELADAEALRVAEQRRNELAAVDERRVAATRLANHVGRRQEESIGGDRDGAP